MRNLKNSAAAGHSALRIPRSAIAFYHPVSRIKNIRLPPLLIKEGSFDCQRAVVRNFGSRRAFVACSKA